MGKAEKQLALVPRSDNERRRQQPNGKAVVSIRLKGEQIAKLDAEAERATVALHDVQPWRGKVTRSDIIERAIVKYLSDINPPATPAKRRTR